MKVLIVQDNIVVNIIKADEDFLNKIKDQYSKVEPMPDYEVKIGAKWNGQIYQNPKNEVIN
jgi:hypothetical protein